MAKFLDHVSRRRGDEYRSKGGSVKRQNNTSCVRARNISREGIAKIMSPPFVEERGLRILHTHQQSDKSMFCVQLKFSISFFFGFSF